MAETFGCDWDGNQAVTVDHDTEHVEVNLHEVGEPGDATCVYLAPEVARRVARAITLASFAVEGQDVTDALFVSPEALEAATRAEGGVEMPDAIPVEPCPETNVGCDPVCPSREDCRESAMRDLFREPDMEPVPYALVDEHQDRADAFLAARELAGPAANLDDVLKLAAFLES
ncbi:hypothetical protein HOS58_gp40 [Streptomyces phage Attoomi]|uniref:Uncharacterized protein n=1 Tax=Streptomyces phage Attoomi TaxID=2059881 RepID=A0A2H5BLJ2_9CAUD|nr:hypothetical protein HOS58_gp40 [Streptomyces phage Attoomi]AUG87172.1 hypothetical protein SEA_ATTOOMI_40 [Streptomyces phage Attoomi]